MWDKFLFGFIIFLRTFVSSSTADVCVTPQCQMEASEIRSRMDFAVDPCYNFYDFACGAFERSFNETIKSVSVIVLMNENVTAQIQQLLTQPTIRGEELDITNGLKSLFHNCMDVDKIEKRGAEPLLEIFKTLGGFPALEKRGSSTNPNEWTVIVKKLREIGLSSDILIDFSIRSDRTNSSRSIIEVCTC